MGAQAPGSVPFSAPQAAVSEAGEGAAVLPAAAGMLGVKAAVDDGAAAVSGAADVCLPARDRSIYNKVFLLY